MKRKDEHRPRATGKQFPVAKRAGEDEPRRQSRPSLPLKRDPLSSPRETRPVRHERGRAGYALADR
jgi:hypothetical protein